MGRVRLPCRFPWERTIVKPAEILSSMTLCEAWGRLTEYRFRYTRIDGTSAEMSREVYDRGHASAVLLFDSDRDSVVLVRQFRPPPMVNGQHPYLLEACAGVLGDDSPEQCAMREAVEEAGIRIKVLQPVAAAYGNPAALTEIVYLYVGLFDNRDRTAGGGLPEEGEDIEVVEMPFADAFAKIANGEIVDMKTIILLQKLMIDRLLGQGASAIGPMATIQRI